MQHLADRGAREQQEAVHTAVEQAKAVADSDYKARVTQLESDAEAAHRHALDEVQRQHQQYKDEVRQSESEAERCFDDALSRADTRAATSSVAPSLPCPECLRLKNKINDLAQDLQMARDEVLRLQQAAGLAMQVHNELKTAHEHFVPK